MLDTKVKKVFKTSLVASALLFGSGLYAAEGDFTSITSSTADLAINDRGGL